MDELALAEELIAYDTSAPEQIQAAQSFIAGWLEARDLPLRRRRHDDLPVLVSEVGSTGPTVIFHTHVDVVPGEGNQFEPYIEGDRLYGRGAYDMKGALAAMMLAYSDLSALNLPVQLKLVVVPDEETESHHKKASERLLEEGLRADFVICGEPTNLQVGIQAKGRLALTLLVKGRSAHGSTPWLGENAILKATSLFQDMYHLPFAKEKSELYAYPSINLGKISGGDVINRVPDTCILELDIRYLPGQKPEVIVEQIKALGSEIEVLDIITRIPAVVGTENPFVKWLGEVVSRYPGSYSEPIFVGRHGASDASHFLAQGIAALEFGPSGENHHGSNEYVLVSSLRTYRKMLVEYVLGLSKTNTVPLQAAHLSKN